MFIVFQVNKSFTNLPINVFKKIKVVYRHLCNAGQQQRLAGESVQEKLVIIKVPFVNTI